MTSTFNALGHTEVQVPTNALALSFFLWAVGPGMLPL